MAGPVVKWAGGKGRVLPQLRALLPEAGWQRYVEPFVGGGAMFFDLDPQRALLADANPDLIRMYEAVRDVPDEVVDGLRRLEATHDELQFYRTRDRFNARGMGDVERAVAFIYLNKTCFNGLYRVNERGHFNAPPGDHPHSIRILDEDSIRAASVRLARAHLRCMDFEEVLYVAEPGDFVYLDPPYEPVTDKRDSFTRYTSNDFGQDQQRLLCDVVRELGAMGCQVMLSNSDTPFIRELYDGFDIQTVQVARAINSDATKRGKVSEVVVRHYREERVMARNGHRKGARGEREVAGILQEWWRRRETASEFIRTPQSGGWRKDTGVRAHFKACGDVMTTAENFPFCVEVKWRENWGVDNVLQGKPSPPWGWWRQCIEAADEQDGVPMMWMRRNRLRTNEAFPWLVWVPLRYVQQMRLSEPDIQWATGLLEHNGVDFGGVLPVAYLYDRFLDMAPQRMKTP